MSVGSIVLALLICVARGPWEKGWIGWGGGCGIRRRDLGADGKVRREEPAAEQVLDEHATEQGEGNVVR